MENLTRGIGAKEAEIPFDGTWRLARADAECTAQPGLVGRCHDLLQTRRVGSFGIERYEDGIRRGEIDPVTEQSDTTAGRMQNHSSSGIGRL